MVKCCRQVLQVAENNLQQDTSLTSQGSNSPGVYLHVCSLFTSSILGVESVPVTPQEDGKENEEPPMSARSTVSRYHFTDA